MTVVNGHLSNCQVTSMPPLHVRSYASDALDAASTTPQWTLFVRQEILRNDSDGNAFVLTAFVPTTASSCAVYETRLDREAIDQHIEELGIEVHAPAFTEMLLKTLAMRTSVDVKMDTADNTTGDVRVVLTYKFSESISRKGQVPLECISTNTPMAVAKLLQAMHLTPNDPVRTALQKLQQQTVAEPTKPTKKTASLSLSLSQESNQSTDSDVPVAPTTSSVNPQLLKRRHVPTGTVRRKGPRGAKLAKLE